MAPGGTLGERLERAVAGFLPEGAAVRFADPAAAVPGEDIFAVEAAAMARAVPKRRAEFHAGRHAAHRAMAALGRLPEPVPHGPDRAPVWPDGLVGSISHCEGACLAVTGVASRVRGLGIDIEPDEALDPETIALVCRPEERAWLAELPDEARGRAARLIFSAKEAAYKLQYPLSGRMLDFAGLSIAPELSGDRFEARFETGAGSLGKGAVLEGRWGRLDRFVFCVMFAL